MEQQTACCRPDLPWKGRGASLEIFGCRFSLYPMDSRFVPIILQALKKTDTSAVWSGSDALSTVYRGKLPYVADAVSALFINAYEPGVHMALEGQFSKGCPGDSDGDSFMEETRTAPNREKVKGIHFPVQCKLALYPLGTADYIDAIAHVFRMAEAKGLLPRSIHYATRIEGDIHAVMEYLEEVCAYMQTAAAHFVLHFTLSINSPTKENAI